MGRDPPSDNDHPSRSGRDFPASAVSDKPSDVGIYDRTNCRYSLEEAPGVGSDRRGRRWARRAYAFDRLHSADAVACDEPTSRRLARCNIWHPVGAAYLRITGVERLRPAPRPTALLAESAIGRTPYI
jgi:hypothetical protein